MYVSASPSEPVLSTDNVLLQNFEHFLNWPNQAFPQAGQKKKKFKNANICEIRNIKIPTAIRKK